MPFYEEKVISPLAIRFTQQRIRETFQDGYAVAATIKEIKAVPSTGDYDIILDAPFPAIEIIRWKPNGRSAGGQAHWFSYDNRRLYCLQKLAAFYWPKRVGAKVEVLYADSGGIRKKLDTQTGGMCVNIGHAFATAGELKEWSWQKAVQARAPPGNFALEAETAIASDDAKSTVSELMDAPAAPSAFDELRPQFGAVSDSLPKVKTANAKEGVTGGLGLTTCAEEALQPKDNALTNLIAQLVASESSSIPAGAPGNSKEDAPEELGSTSIEASAQTNENSLSSLIGQLMDLKSKDDVQANDFASNETRSTESDAGGCESTGLSPSSPSSVASNSSNAVSDDEDKQEKPESVVAEVKQEQPKKKNSKTARAAKEGPQVHAGRSNQKSQVQMAQYQMAQWQMAQWQAAQMAQWQQANQSAQLRAAYQARAMGLQY